MRDIEHENETTENFKSFQQALDRIGNKGKKMDMSTQFLRKQAFFFSPVYSDLMDTFIRKGLPLTNEETIVPTKQDPNKVAQNAAQSARNKRQELKYGEKKSISEMIKLVEQEI